MRIVSEPAHPVYKITVFQHDSRYSIKIETGECAQTYKLKQGPGMETVADVHALMDNDFMIAVDAAFVQLHKNLHAAQERKMEDEEEFDEII